jgi:hypothetical protein
MSVKLAIGQYQSIIFLTFAWLIASKRSALLHARLVAVRHQSVTRQHAIGRPACRRLIIMHADVARSNAPSQHYPYIR